jgi:4-hydroxy-tetrahydrodipicolinate synthase
MAMMPLMNFLDEGKFVQKIKHGCELAGLEAGTPRLPLLPLDPEEERELETIVAALKRDVAAVAAARKVEEPVR